MYNFVEGFFYDTDKRNRFQSNKRNSELRKKKFNDSIEDTKIFNKKTKENYSLLI